MENKELKFTHNWNNKLYNKAFTTIRQSDRFNVGDRVNIILNGQCIKVASIKAKKRYRIKDMTEAMAYIDTGYPLEETLDIISKMFGCEKISPDAYFYWYLVAPHKAEQLELFK